jgi:acyl-CoA thioesterase FadM
MNLYLRLIFIYFRARRASIIRLVHLSNTLSCRVFPNDLDLNLHVNNGRYLSLCDLSRFDLFVRTGLLSVMKKNRWVPLIAYHDMNYKKSLSLFQKFSMRMEITSFDDKYFYAKHIFESKGSIVAEGTSKAVIRGKAGVIPPSEVIAAVEKWQSAVKD